MLASGEMGRTPVLTRSGIGTVLGFALLASAASIEAQLIRGTLLDAEADRPIPAGRLVALDSAFAPVATGFSDEMGRFALTVNNPPRQVWVYASALSYRTFLDGPFDLSTGDTLELEFRIQPHALPVEALSVVAEARRSRLVIIGFYERQRVEPFGVFMTRDQLDEIVATKSSDYFRRISGVSVVPQRYGAWRVLLRNRCAPRLYVDGMWMRGLIDQLVLPEEIEGVEIYRSAAQVPLRYGGTGASCGVVLIWTR